jgi:hypothetical protein
MIKGVFGSLRILHIGLLVGLILFTGIVIFLKLSDGFPSLGESTDRILQVVVILISLPSLVFGFKLFKKGIMEARQMNAPAAERMVRYRSACIMWWAMIDVPGVFEVVGFLLTGNFAYLFLAGFHILLLVLFTPRKDNIAVLLNFSGEEAREME